MSVTANTCQLSKRGYIANLMSHCLEWYDFMVYSALSPILATLIFPTHEDHSALVLIYLIFAAGFITRPISAIGFGYLADKYGRRIVLIVTISLMSIATFCMGLLPTYDQIGILAPLALLILRCLQGLAVGGEYPITVSNLAESVPYQRRGYFTSFINLTTVLGILIATLVTAGITQTLSTEHLYAYGWRIPFIIGAMGMIVVGYMRLRLSDSPLYMKTKRQQALLVNPIITLVKTHYIEAGKIFVFCMLAALGYYTYNLFTTTYLYTEAHFAYLPALYVTLSGQFLLILFIPIAGYLSDCLGRRHLVMASAIGFFLLSLPLYILIQQGTFLGIFTAQFIFAVLLALYLGPLPAIIAEQTITPLRCSCVGLGYNLSLTLFGSTAPMVHLLLIDYLQSPLAPGIYLTVIALISLSVITHLRDGSKKVLV